MKKKSIRTKLAIDLFTLQGKWTVWFLGIMFVVYIAHILYPLIYTGESGRTVDDFYARSYIFGNIYMLVIGIITSISCLPYYVQNGITRRDYFFGATIGTLGLAIIIPLVALIIRFLTKGMIDWTNLPIELKGLTDIHIAEEDSFIAQMILAVIYAPSVVEISGLSILVFTVNLFFYYVIGWMIGAGFYRFGGIKGMMFIVLALAIFLINSGIWGNPVPAWLPIPDLTLSFYAIIGTVLLIFIVLGIIRLVTRNVRIKL